jgi:hypothetical protein
MRCAGAGFACPMILAIYYNPLPWMGLSNRRRPSRRGTAGGDDQEIHPWLANREMTNRCRPSGTDQWGAWAGGWRGACRG